SYAIFSAPPRPAGRVTFGKTHTPRFVAGLGTLGKPQDALANLAGCRGSGSSGCSPVEPRLRFRDRFRDIATRWNSGEGFSLIWGGYSTSEWLGFRDRPTRRARRDRSRK